MSCSQIAMVARQELPVERWKELLAIINQLCHSQAANERLVCGTRVKYLDCGIQWNFFFLFSTGA